MPRKPRGKTSGGQPGNRNALKTGAHTAPVRARRIAVRQMILRMNATTAVAHRLAAGGATNSAPINPTSS